MPGSLSNILAGISIFRTTNDILSFRDTKAQFENSLKKAFSSQLNANIESDWGPFRLDIQPAKDLTL